MKYVQIYDCGPTCYFCMQLEELGERVVGGEALDAVVGDPVLGPALRALHLPLHVVHQALHARVQAVRVLAWQQLRGPVPVQADAAGEQLVKLLHGWGRGEGGAAPAPAALYFLSLRLTPSTAVL